MVPDVLVMVQCRCGAWFWPAEFEWANHVDGVCVDVFGCCAIATNVSPENAVRWWPEVFGRDGGAWTSGAGADLSPPKKRLQGE